MLNCPRCGSDRIQKRGTTKAGKQIYQCQNEICDHPWFRDEDNTVLEKEPTKDSYFKEEGTKGEVGFKTYHRITTLDELIDYCQIDLGVWEIERWICNKWEVGRKEKQVDMTWEDGLASGSVYDTGKVFVEPLFQVKVWLRKKIEEIRATNNIKDQIEEAKKFAPKYPRISYKKLDNGLLYEIGMPDLHFGRLTWDEESGENFDVKIAKEVANDVVDRLLSYTRNFPVSKILLPFGNDFFNVNNKQETTAHGTPQQEDTRWQKTFRLGRELAVQIIDKCSVVAPVDVLIIPGNHDEEKMFFLGDAVQSWYHNSPNVNVDNGAAKRKYYQFGTDMIGFTHGYYEKVDKLALLMALEAPKMWGDTTIREMHLGDKHNKKDIEYKTDEGCGVTVRILRALAAKDAWTVDKGYVGALRAAESFLWHPTEGLLAQFTAVVK